MAKKPTPVTVKTPKAAMPSSKVDINLVAGSVEPAMKAADAKSTKLYKVPVNKIMPIPGFNVRVESPDYLAHRDALAASIRTNGFDQTQPLAGYVHKDREGNVIYVTSGHTRLAAVRKLNSNPDFTPKIDSLPVLVHPATTSLADLTVALHTSNTGRPLTPFELGVVVKRLLKDEGADKTAIAGRLAVTPRYLDDVLLLVNSPKSVRDAVLEGSVSSTMAIQTLRKSPDTAADVIATALTKAKAAGKTKATKKDAGPKMKKIKATVSVGEGTDMKEIVKAVAALVRKAIPSQADGTDEDAIKLASVSGTITLTVELPDDSEPKAKKPKPAPKKTAEPAAKKPAAKKPAAAAPAPEPVKPAPKKGGKKPAAAKPAPVEDDDNLTAEDDDAIEGAEEVTSEGIDDEPAQPVIAVKNGEGVGDDVDI